MNGNCTRRRFLAVSGGIAITGLAGCLGSEGAGGDDALPDHPATRDIESRPRLGPAPADAEATLVAFESPDCDECKEYTEETLPRIRSELVESGRLAYFGRLTPEYEWGWQAAYALEGVRERNEEAYWDLGHYYYENQPELDENNVLERTEAFLEGVSGVDAAELVEEVDAGEYDDAVQAEYDAWQDAGGTERPMLYSFRDGEFVTKIAGPQGYSTIKGSLGL